MSQEMTSKYNDAINELKKEWEEWEKL